MLKEHDFYKDQTGVSNDRVFENALKLRRGKSARRAAANEPFPQDSTVGARGVQLIEASYQSSGEGRRVVLDNLSVQKGSPTNSFMSNLAAGFRMYVDGDENPADWLSVSEDVILEACGNPLFPESGIIEQVWKTNSVPAANVPGAVAEAAIALSFAVVPEGSEVALGVGSCGIVDIPDIIVGIADVVSGADYESLVFLAMGSHSDMIGDGQREMLNEFSVAEE